MTDSNKKDVEPVVEPTVETKEEFNWNSPYDTWPAETKKQVKVGIAVIVGAVILLIGVVWVSMLDNDDDYYDEYEGQESSANYVGPPDIYSPDSILKRDIHRPRSKQDCINELASASPELQWYTPKGEGKFITAENAFVFEIVYFPNSKAEYKTLTGKCKFDYNGNIEATGVFPTKKGYNERDRFEGI